MATHLPVLEPKGSLRKDGSRDYVHPADVSGRFTRLRFALFGVLIAVLLSLPWLHVSGRPALLFDIEHRKFFLFGLVFNAQDAWLVFFLLSGVGFTLIFLTAMLGRVWCGYLCPQTVFLEGAFRRIERLLEGPRAQRLKRNQGPMTFDKAWRKGIKHFLFIAISLAIGHAFLAYFVSVPSLFDMLHHNPREHAEAFAWMLGFSSLFYLNFSWFREQLCLVVCPYGRLQSVLTDDDTIVIGYDSQRGEPRGKAQSEGAGDCVDCDRCVVVCPTGIDIRNGLQVDCIGCAACIDACDEIMTKLDRKPGLIRYDSQAGLSGRSRRLFRPRIAVYLVLGVVGLVVAMAAAHQRQSFEANLLRSQGEPFVVEGGTVRNELEIHLVNKSGESAQFELVPAAGQVSVVIPLKSVTVPSLDHAHVPVFATVNLADEKPGLVISVEVRMRSSSGTEMKTLTAQFVGPGAKP